MEKRCMVCKEMFTKDYSTSKKVWKTRKFCSRKCFHIQHGKDMIGHRGWNKGLTKETSIIVRQMAQSNKGKIPWNKGKKLEYMRKLWQDPDYRKKMIKSGEENGHWKGDNINFKFRHRTRYYRKTHDSCEDCGVKQKRIDIHHIDGDLKNNEKENLVALCRKCHNKYHYSVFHKGKDGRFLKFKKKVLLPYKK